MDGGATARSGWRPVLVALLGVAIAGCKGHGRGAQDAGPPIEADGATALRDGGAGGVDANAPPPDDMIPPTTSDDLTARARHLLEAISKDDSDLALDIIFPRAGWIAQRDVEDPGKEWDAHVDRTFRHAVHALSRRAQGAQFVSIELGRAVVQESPRHHGWKKPLWSVHGSRLTYVVDGHTRSITIRELTAWRGAWYVTRLR